MNFASVIASSVRIPSPRRLKQQAKELQRVDPLLQHKSALNGLVQQLGYRSYDHYLEQWKLIDTNDRMTANVTLSARWEDQRLRDRGTMDARVNLSAPWWHFLPLSDRRSIRSHWNFRISSSGRDRLIAKHSFASEHSCLLNLNKAIRQLIFVDAMRVLPGGSPDLRNVYRRTDDERLASKLEYLDHDSAWYEPASGVSFLLNEPYQVDTLRQAEVFSKRGFKAWTTWEWTTHNPEGTCAQLIARTDHSKVLEQLAARSAVLPSRFNSIEFVHH